MVFILLALKVNLANVNLQRCQDWTRNKVAAAAAAWGSVEKSKTKLISHEALPMLSAAMPSPEILSISQ